MAGGRSRCGWFWLKKFVSPATTERAAPTTAVNWGCLNVVVRTDAEVQGVEEEKTDPQRMLEEE